MAGPGRDGVPRLRIVDEHNCADWESVYTENVVAVYRMIHRQVGNRPDAEDLTEEVFLAALPRLRLPASRPSVRSYLTATARTVVADHWRRHYASPPTAPLPDDILARPPEPFGADEPGGRIAGVLARLPDRLRQILELRFLHGMSFRHAAAEMGVTVANARVLQHRALRRAADLIEEVE